MTVEDIVAELVALREAHADLKTRVERMFRLGRVTDVDSQKRAYRQEIGIDPETGDAIKSGWIPVAQVAGARKGWSMPSVGQSMVMVSPDGDPSQAYGMPGGWSDENPAPSQRADEDVETRGDTRITMRGDKHMSVVDKAGFAMLKKGCVVITVDRVDLIKFLIDPKGDRIWKALADGALVDADEEDLT